MHAYLCLLREGMTAPSSMRQVPVLPLGDGRQRAVGVRRREPVPRGHDTPGLGAALGSRAAGMPSKVRATLVHEMDSHSNFLAPTHAPRPTPPAAQPPTPRAPRGDATLTAGAGWTRRQPRC